MYDKILGRFREISEKLDNHNIESVLNRAEDALSAEHKFNITIVSGCADYKDLLRIVCDLCSEDIAYCYGDNLFGKSCQFIFKYGNKESKSAFTEGKFIELTKENENAVFDEVDSVKIIHTLPNRFLENADITLCNGLHKKNIWQEIFENTDFLVLLTNATMALSLEEREWIISYVLPYFGGERFCVIANNTELLNSDKDRETMCEYIDNHLNKIDEGIEFYRENGALFDHINNMLANQEQAKVLRTKNILNNLYSNFKKIAEELLNSAQLDIASSAKAIKQLEDNRKELEAAGKVNSENMVKNIYADFKFKAIESIENYSDSAKNSILRKIDESTDVEGISQDIERYLKSVWKTYELHFSKKMAEAREYAVECFVGQMEMDTDRIINNLDVETISLIEKAIRSADSWNAPAFYNITVSENARENFVKKTVNGIMIASVPLFFVNPVYGIATLIGSQIYKKTQKNSILDEEKSLISESVEKYCDELKRIITASIIENLDNEADECRKNIKTAYASLTDLLIKEIQTYSNNLKAVREKRALLEDVLNNRFADIINEL